ncbi:ribosomal protein S18 acetylase RimI-like enzyme [Nocardia transvalensis]|uniref:Ribosomal protein S18 acetylase RimI-like enzyme n=1 Tax=Nocardia transvalensis TaxID=37333 RepID=A0A7W9UFY8_9NOCA|nr:GNAT family N-acetyltransferase [Nocardia transvalensis]MBB5911718.1 ribosomal protein S18 acetylase RimI-like enzyme [Nocardia transvalensis]
MTTKDINFEHYTAAQARELRPDVEDIFRGSYIDTIESGEPFESPEAFMTRFDTYTDPNRPAGFELVMARIDGEPIGQAWGWPLTSGTHWWDGLQLDDGDPTAFTAETGVRTFALSEIMVRKAFTGRGIARALHDELLDSRSEQRATLLVRPDNRRAYATYLRWGWHRIGVLKPDWPNAPQFDALVRASDHGVL